MSRLQLSPLERTLERWQRRVYGNGWAARLVRALGGASAVRIQRYQVTLQNWPVGTPPLRIGFASDFHAGPLTHPELIDSACEALGRLRPDLLLFGGDFVSPGAGHLSCLTGRLAGLEAPLGRFAVLGNHDHYADARLVTERLEAVGVRVLTNRNLQLPPPWEQVWLCGIDDWGYGEPSAPAALAGAEGVRLVLMHSPSNLEDLGDARWEVALCGHVHGGQIALPGGRPLVVPRGPLSRRYPRGRFELPGGRTLLVSLGVGTSGVPLRLFAPPEVLEVEVGSGK